MQPKLKSFARSEQLFTAILLCVIALISFMLGRYSVIEPTLTSTPVENTAGVVFIDTADETVATDGVTVVASKSGSKYHLLTCSGASSIKEANKIYFDSIEQAKAAGYTPAANCSF